MFPYRDISFVKEINKKKIKLLQEEIGEAGYRSRYTLQAKQKL